jgi:uncharacterized Zn finger protein
MTALPAISEATIRAHAAADSYSRGLSYYERGAVVDLALRGSTIHGRVEGSQYTPYRVAVNFDGGGITSASCSCPYDWGGWCKHIVAVLLACMQKGAAIEIRPSLDVILAELDRAQLQTLLLDLSSEDLDLADRIERQALLLRLAATAPVAEPPGLVRAAGSERRRSPIDGEAIRRQVRAAMQPPRRGRYDNYDYYDDEDPGREIVQAIDPLLDQARSFMAGGDGVSALAILEALTDAYLEGCEDLSRRMDEMYGIPIDETAPGEFSGELGEVWAEAILLADLPADEHEEWGEKIAEFRDRADDYGMGAAFDIALTAAEQGWEYPPLRRVLAGEITEQGAWEGESPVYSDELALIRLRLLERQGRLQEYLYLAEAEGQIELYVLMLAKMGRTQEAVAEGLRYLRTPASVFDVAKALRERGDFEGAWRIAEHGITLPSITQAISGYAYSGEPGKSELAAWAAELAASQGQGERALRAAEAAFRAAPSLNAYLRAQELAGEHWEQVRPALLEHLRGTHASEAKVDVFLHERLFDDAIAAVQNGYGPLLERVMDAVVAIHPDWVIQAATAQAERIMNAGDAQRYDQAVGWLRRARAGFSAANRAADWRGYLESIRALHGRKYKLMGLLAQL